jgi:hypothetical protein
MLLPSLRSSLAAILIGSALLFPSCRENDSATGSSSAIRYQPSFRTGDRARYSVYDISPSGIILQQTKRPSVWTVIATSATRYGRSGVTVIVDSTAGSRPDTLFYCFESGGDVYLYGFLSGIESLRSGRRITPGWDRVAVFSAGPLAQWQVGSLDTRDEDPLYGEITDGLEYVAAPLNGENTVFAAYRVDFTGPSVDASMWFAETPPCVPVSFVSFWMDTTGRGRWLDEVVRPPQ